MREKLIDLMTAFYGVDPAYYGVEAQPLADHLIANGVTVQEWIPVSERLPDAGKVLCLTTKGHYKVMEWLETFKCWTDPGGIDFTNFKRGYVTHWMPLPEPPNEEK